MVFMWTGRYTYMFARLRIFLVCGHDVLCTWEFKVASKSGVGRRFTHARSCCSCLLDCVARHAVNHRTARRKDHPAPKQEGQVLRGGASCSTFSKKELRKEKIQVTEYKIPSLLVLLCDL